jgi:hypothetical protein
MRPSPDQAAVLDALRVVIDPDLGKDIVSLGFVKQLAIDASGAVRLRHRADDARLSGEGPLEGSRPSKRWSRCRCDVR